jgi:hypothetical protein
MTKWVRHFRIAAVECMQRFPNRGNIDQATPAACQTAGA